MKLEPGTLRSRALHFKGHWRVSSWLVQQHRIVNVLPADSFTSAHLLLSHTINTHTHVISNSSHGRHLRGDNGTDNVSLLTYISHCSRFLQYSWFRRWRLCTSIKHVDDDAVVPHSLCARSRRSGAVTWRLLYAHAVGGSRWDSVRVRAGGTWHWRHGGMTYFFYVIVNVV